MKSYDLQVEGLAEAVAAAAPSPKHADLLQAIRRLPGLKEAFLATSREGGWLQRRQVLTPAGAVVNEDHATWLREELARDNGRADITAARLRRWMDAPYGF